MRSESSTTGNRGPTRGDAREMDDFLRSIERRAFLMARVRLGNEEDAFDVIQDAMLRLVQRYAGRDAAEWGPLFYRILHNRINDLNRRRRIGNRLFSWIERRRTDEDDPRDEAENLPGPAAEDPARVLEAREGCRHLMRAVAALPPRQQQAFMLRCWEGLSTRETARAMACSEGSVKTHYSRALQVLRDQLEGHKP
jgi:RNA polymerase sigma-70 factor (ECF subfamily)